MNTPKLTCLSINCPERTGGECTQDREALDVFEFLCESNAIEGVTDGVSLSNAINAWTYLIKQDVLTLEVVLETHRLLMKNQPLRESEIGKFRTVPVYIGGHQAMNHTLIGGEIVMRFCFETMRAYPLPDWQALHVMYEHIHPFVDGNGRTGRMFMNWTRMKRCGLPVLIIKASERGDYYKWFK